MNKPSQLQDMCWQLSEMLSEDLSNEDMMVKLVLLQPFYFQISSMGHSSVISALLSTTTKPSVRIQKIEKYVPAECQYPTP